MSKPSVSTFLAQVKQQLAELPSALSGALLLSAVRLSDSLQQALDPDGLKVTEAGKLELDRLGALREPYAAPELLKGTAPPRDPRVLVYSAGALGYELVMLRPLSGEPGAELGGPLAGVIRRALSRDRDKRFRNLAEMARALEAIQAPPTPEEEELILAAIASTGAHPPQAQKPSPAAPARKAAIVPPPPEPKPAPRGAARVPELLGDRWDPVSSVPPPLGDPELVVLHPTEALEARNPGPAITPLPMPVARPAVDVRELVAAEARSRKDELAALQSRLDALARVDAKVATFEQRLREITLPPGDGAKASQPQVPLARRVKELIEERCYDEAEAALRVPALASDPLLQLRLGQVLSARTDLPASRAGEIEAAFRRAAELDPAWPLPKALLGARLLARGRRREGEALLREALALDPACPEALLALRAPPRRSLFVLGGGIALGGLAVALLLPFVLRHVDFAPVPVVPVGTMPVVTSAPVPTPAPVEAAPSAPAPQADPGAAAAPVSAPVAKSPAPASAPARAEAPPKRARRVASAQSANRGAALEAAVRGDKAVRAFDTASALKAFQTSLKLDPSLPEAHRGLGMVYVLQGHNAEAKAEYRRYLELLPGAPDRPQIERLLAH